MGGMTIDAPSFVKQWPMHALLVQCLIHHLVMTALAEFKSVFLEAERRCGLRVVMTLIAHFTDNRLVDIVIKNRPLTGAVRIMAGGTAALFHRIIEMPGLKGCLIGLVAFETE